MKRAAAWSSWAALGVALAWGAGLLQARWQVGRAVARLREEHLLKTEPGSHAGAASAEGVARQGPRALPALVAELDPALSPYYLCRVADCITDLSEGEAPRVVFDEDPARRRTAVETLRAWWRERGGEHHRWWRFWNGSRRS